MGNMHSRRDWIIRINGGEPHPRPHAHINFRDGSKVSVCIATGEVLVGSVLPSSRLRAAPAWIAANREALVAEYRRLNP